MSTEGKKFFNTHSFEGSCKQYKIGLVVAEWNFNITESLLDGACAELLKHGVHESNIFIDHCPGAFELPLACKLFINKHELDGVVAIGSVIKGETPHFDFVCQAAADGILQVSLESKRPVIFCVLTDNTLQQAIDRSGGKHGNKGEECALACLKMIQKIKE